MTRDRSHRCPTCFEPVDDGAACQNPLCIQDAAERTLNDLPVGADERRPPVREKRLELLLRVLPRLHRLDEDRKSTRLNSSHRT